MNILKILGIFVIAGSVVAGGNPEDLAPDPLSATYRIENRDISLQNGRSAVNIAPDSATKIRTWVVGDGVEGDLDGDGDRDTALILAHDPGGSGTFYYVTVAENCSGSYRGTRAVFLGDRIAPLDLRIRDGVIVARYARRMAHEPMSHPPSVETTLSLAFDRGELKALLPVNADE